MWAEPPLSFTAVAPAVLMRGRQLPGGTGVRLDASKVFFHAGSQAPKHPVLPVPTLTSL